MAKMGKTSVAPNAREEILEHLRRIDGDPGYQAIRLRGLAGLLRASGGLLQELANLPEVTFFLASTLDEISQALDGDD
jgi:hypothetical protein